MFTASLDKETFDSALEFMRIKIAKEFGVTLIQDISGAYGKAGETKLVIRFLKDNKNYTVSFSLNQLSCAQYDNDLENWMNEDK